MKKNSKVKLDEDLKPFSLRIPSYLKLWLSDSADNQRTSINTEIIKILEEKHNAANNKNKV